MNELIWANYIFSKNKKKMDVSSAILCQFSALKDMLDEVNEEIYANFQITRDMEVEIVECSEFDRTLAVSESELMKTMYMLQF
ncbi:hypothetical protein HanPI659440_Chr08g0301881 [Helianthus annuus]|nr:hypothetical protein HanPI659440_Chr08g0301881 [Helianthus annuus]